jgi:undecaprenyl-diphosphatase
MVFVEILILAVVQGIAEFLPISSSGHIVVLSALFDQSGRPTGDNLLDDKLLLNVVLHLGTLAAILVFYWPRIVRLLGQDRRVIGLLLVGTLPAVAAVLLLERHLEAAANSALVAGCMFPVTGLMLLWTARKTPGSTDCRDLSYPAALGIGVLQAFAILPGISRSGATIVAGLAFGLNRQEAAAFSFLLAVPAIVGAGLWELLKLLRQPATSDPLALLALGAVLAFLVGLASLWWLVRWLGQGRLHYFAWWVLILGPVVIAWQLLSR